MTAAELDIAMVYRQHLDYVWSSLRRVGAPAADLEDLAHEVFLVVHRRLPDYDRARPLKPWLFGIAFRVASEHRRKVARRSEQGGDQDALPAAGEASPEAQTSRKQAVELARKALLAIDEEARAVFILAELDGVAVTEVAHSLEIPVNTAYTRLRRARLAVASALTGGAT